MYGHYLVKPGVGLGHHIVEPEEVWEIMCQGVSDLNLKYFILNAGSASVEISFLLMFFGFIFLYCSGNATPWPRVEVKGLLKDDSKVQW